MKNRLPIWFKQEIPDATVRGRKQLLSEFNINTVCCQAKCPNLSFCFKNLKFTFMILGNTCTRNCRFCGVNSIKKSRDNLRLSQEPPLTVDQNEPYRISQIVKIFNLKFVVITSVSRDDLDDGGAAQFAKTIELIRNIDKNIKIEVLIPDFSGNIASLKTVIDAKPSILAHNIETVRRLYKTLRPKANYQTSLDMLKKSKEINPLLITKSSLILGVGEREDEIIYTMEDLRCSQCDILTLGQYLAPSDRHYPVKEFISIEQFQRYRRIGLRLGFKVVLSGPKVRSSYQAEEVLGELEYV
ncbi:MAG: lipoyl synthase [Candidatus Omnitrophica bacterium CG23_combo_of_CG06-09_8_20_14_all_40_11]|nr:MAG: lipoyl synthase [Candidatus Omnitrophica bacterium CG23_combo_of_CG06-09_8_20_14_all_40_11]